jgi:glycosyltransferase involved in cell wall biosynthesis
MSDNMLNMPKLPLIIIIQSLKSAGPQMQAVRLSNMMADRFDVKLLVFFGEDCDERVVSTIEDGYEVILLKGNYLLRVWRAFWLFRENRQGISLSYLMTENILNGVFATLAGVRLRLGGFRSSVHHPLKLRLQKFLHNYMLSGSIVNSYRGRDALISNGLKEDKLHVIHNGIDATASHLPVERKSTVSSKEVILLSVGRFATEKDFLTTIRAFGLLVQSCAVPVRLELVGHGELEQEVRQWVSESAVHDQIDIIVNPPDVYSLYMKADIYVSSSLYEGLSNSIMEAILHSLPAVVTDVGDNRHLVKDGETGFVVSVRSPAELAHRLQRLVEDSKLRQSLGDVGFLHLSEYFSLEAFSHSYLELFKAPKEMGTIFCREK